MEENILCYRVILYVIPPTALQMNATHLDQKQWHKSVHAEPWNYNISNVIIWLFQTYTHDLEPWKTLNYYNMLPNLVKAGLLDEMEFVVATSITG